MGRVVVERDRSVDIKSTCMGECEEGRRTEWEGMKGTAIELTVSFINDDDLICQVDA